MSGRGAFISEHGFIGFFILLVFIAVLDCFLEQFVDSEKQRKVLLYFISTLVAFLCFYIELL